MSRRLRLPSLLLLLALAAPGHAIEIRRGEGALTVPADETVADTLIVMGDTVAVDGDVEGDLIVLARQLTVRGDVAGSLLAAAQAVTIEGTVGGNVVGLGRSVMLAGARVERNLYGFGADVTVGTSAEVAGNAAALGESVGVHGSVGVDLLAFARSVEVGGEVRRNVDAHARDVVVLPAARIGGDVTAHVPQRENLRTPPAGAIGGEVTGQFDERAGPLGRYFTAGFYLRQALRLAALFVAGLLLLWLFAGLRAVSVRDARDALGAAGRGLVTAIGLPVLCVVLAITIIGIPLALAGFLLWGLGLYLAKAVVGQLVGRQLFRAPNGAPHYAATLAAGLVMVLIAVNLPLVGWIVNVAVTLLGLGLLTRYALGLARPGAA